MPDPNIAELRKLTGNLTVASNELLQFLKDLDRHMILKVDGLDPCDPIIVNPDPPTVGLRSCIPSVIAGEALKVGHFFDSLLKLDAWIRDINDVAGGLDPDIDLVG